MHVTIITAFPEFFQDFLSTSIIGRAIESGVIQVDVVNLREYGLGNYRQIDDYSFGSGGMVLMPGPLVKALDKAKERSQNSWVVYPSPQGAMLTQEMVESLASREDIVIICGHYEGIDERFVEKYVDLEVSLGDFVLTGGEIPTMAIIDSMARLVPGVVGRDKAVEEDSFFRGMLDFPHYTRPSEWKGVKVPPVLLSGNEKEITKWRDLQAVQRTLRRRPDLLSRANITSYLQKGVYLALVHHPVLNRAGEVTTAAITGLDLSDIGRSCKTYGVRKFLVVTPLKSQRELAKTMADHWMEGYGALFNPSRAEAFKEMKTVATLEKAIEWIVSKEREKPTIIGTTARTFPGSVHWLEVKRSILEEQKPVLFLFGTASGLPDEVLDQCSEVLQPLSGGYEDYNHLSVRTAVGVILDRFFGWR
ncbi:MULTISPECIES: tRNA (guanosine(37)-N1)-methyltransferase TrmD [Aminobacterium]|jgi:tRNA (guanine37-N1)-methyltransferase|uniref:tRNA (guanosine(37)-N1)-methyltransferase TrmD n=1 Tax=Aminobacterium TaxID=81466 RepID=UPI000465ACE7|nr:MULTISPECIES: tRNA (guanosine(37)-N1)-methyltransferase TrmD [Aminobacterium]